SGGRKCSARTWSPQDRRISSPSGNMCAPPGGRAPASPRPTQSPAPGGRQGRPAYAGRSSRLRHHGEIRVPRACYGSSSRSTVVAPGATVTFTSLTAPSSLFTSFTTYVPSYPSRGANGVVPSFFAPTYTPAHGFTSAASFPFLKATFSVPTP